MLSSKFQLLMRILDSLQVNVVACCCLPWNIAIQLHNELNFDLMNLIDANIWDIWQTYLLWLLVYMEQSEIIFTPCTKVHWPFTNCSVSRKLSIVWIFRECLFCSLWSINQHDMYFKIVGPFSKDGTERTPWDNI